jgi:hypothetical protein
VCVNEYVCVFMFMLGYLHVRPSIRPSRSVSNAGSGGRARERLHSGAVGGRLTVTFLDSSTSVSLNLYVAGVERGQHSNLMELLTLSHESPVRCSLLKIGEISELGRPVTQAAPQQLT